MTVRLRPRLVALGHMVLLGLVVAALVRVGHGALAPPDHWSASGLRAWSESRDPIIMSLSLVRLVALALSGQVLIGAGLAGLGGLVRAPWLLRASNLVTLPGLRGLVRRLAGLSLSLSAAVTPAHPQGGAHAPVVLERIESSPVGSGRVVLTRLSDPPPMVRGGTGDPNRRHKATASMRRLDDDAGATLTRLDPDPSSATTRSPEPKPTDTPATMNRLDPAATTPPADPPEVAVDRPGSAVPIEPAQTPAAPDLWIVRPGDHLWSISEATLAQAWGRHPSERETDDYWRAVVRANPQIADPDLVFAGQPVHLPPPPTRPS